MHYFDWQFLVCENFRFKIIYSSFSGTDQAWDWIHCIVTWHYRVRSQTEERNLIRHCILCWSVCCACSYQRTSAFAWGNWKSWTKCITSVKQPSWKPVSKIWSLLHDINLHIYFDCYCSFWEKFLLKRFLFGINIVAWLTSYCTSSREMQLEDGRFLMAAERYDSLLKVWPLLALSEFYFYGLTSTYTSTWIVISLRGHVTSFQKIIISIKINNQSKTQSFTSMWQFTYC